MKKVFVGALAAFSLLLGASLALAQDAVALGVRAAFAALPPQFKIEAQDISYKDNLLVLKNVTITHNLNAGKPTPQPAKPGEKPAAKPDEPKISTLPLAMGYPDFVAKIESVTLENPNLLAFAGGVAPLADKVTVNNVSMNLADSNNINRFYGTITVKQKMVVQLNAPWAELYALARRTDVTAKEAIEQLVLAQGQSAQVDAVVYKGAANDPTRLSIDKINFQEYGLFNAKSIDMRNFQMSSHKSSTVDETFSIASAQASYDLRSLAKEYDSDVDEFLSKAHIPSRALNLYYKLQLNKIQSTFSDMVFTIAGVDLNINSALNSTSSFKLDTFRMEPQDLRRGFLGKELVDALKNKPLIVSMEAKSMLSDTFQPNSFKITVDSLANLELKAMLMEKPGLDAASRDHSGETQLLNNYLLQSLMARYEDKGLINGMIEVMAKQRRMPPAQYKAEQLQDLDRQIARAQDPSDKIWRDFLKAGKELLQMSKPGSLTFNVTPKTPDTLSKIMDALSENTDSLKYDFKVSK